MPAQRHPDGWTIVVDSRRPGRRHRCPVPGHPGPSGRPRERCGWSSVGQPAELADPDVLRDVHASTIQLARSGSYRSCTMDEHRPANGSCGCDANGVRRQRRHGRRPAARSRLPGLGPRPARRAARPAGRANSRRTGEPSWQLGALPYHREHGSDPAGAGVDCAVRRARAVRPDGLLRRRAGSRPPVPGTARLGRRPAERCWLVTAKVCTALTAMGRPRGGSRRVRPGLRRHHRSERAPAGRLRPGDALHPLLRGRQTRPRDWRKPGSTRRSRSRHCCRTRSSGPST